MGARARLAQRPRRVAVRARLGGQAEAEDGGRKAEVNPESSAGRPADRVEVVAGVITRPDGRFLLAQRPAGKVYAGYWEFPGGKVERGESPVDAIRRELHEELGIDVTRACPWLTRDYDYEHAAVRLRFYRVTGWRGEPHGREAQQFAWQSPQATTVSPMLPANGPILRALGLPAVYGISNATALGVDAFLERLERALAAGLRLVQIREKQLPEQELFALVTQATALVHHHSARVLVNGDVALAQQARADGVHLTSAQLMAAASRPECEWVSASCHDARELAQAVALGADFVVLGPVFATPSHPGTHVLGWDGFSQLLKDYPLPVYALGGLRPENLGAAWQAGGHGIAMMRGAW
ncbi:MAG: Nudix family hydrolase [Burkholderiales bacterium]|nr:Nudix family hydrolase [Burkholderiales bacterium]